MNLAVVNVLPLPPLDGGRVAVSLLQAALGNRISVAFERYVYLVGFVFLMALCMGNSVRYGHTPEDVTSEETWPPRWSSLRSGEAPGSGAVEGDPHLPGRRETPTVDIGGFKVGSRHPIVVQSMTNTDTADADATALQVAALAHAGSELVRVTVNNDAAAAAVPEIRRKLDGLGVGVPIIGDFHYNGHQLLIEYPEMAQALAKYRINPGNVGTKRHDENFVTIIRVALEYDKPVRIGVNWGSLDQQLLTELMDANAASATPADSRDVMIEAMIQSALRSAELAEATGLAHDRIIISAKVSQVRDLVDVYRLLAARCDYPLHLGLTEAGMAMKGIVASTAGLALLLEEGIGDTIRVSLTPEPGGDRTEEVLVAQQVLQSLGLRSFLPRCRPVPAAAARRRPSSRRWPRRSRAICASRCPSGPPRTPASRRCAWRSWAAWSTAPASPSTPTSASRCRARSRSRSHRSSSTARCEPLSAAKGS